MDFGADSLDFRAAKQALKPKRRKYEKPMFYFRKTYVLEGPGLSILMILALFFGTPFRSSLFHVFVDFGVPCILFEQIWVPARDP